MNKVDDYQDEEPDLYWGFISLTIVSKFIGNFLYNCKYNTIISKFLLNNNKI